MQGGCAAAVGLTATGWSGRYIEYGLLRALPESMPVGKLESIGIRVLSLDRDAMVPAADDLVHTNRWVRPRLVGNRPVLLVVPKGSGEWVNIGEKRRKESVDKAQRRN
jgi:hypothetical protein